MKERNRLKEQKKKNVWRLLMIKFISRVYMYEVMKGLWKGLAVPTIMYGLEVTEVVGLKKKKKRKMKGIRNCP